jgi:hypothetical protein
MIRKEYTKSGAFLVLEVLGANVQDRANLLNVSRLASVKYSTGKFAAVKEKQILLDELTSLMVKADRARGRQLPPPGPSELKTMRQRYFRQNTLIGRLVQRIGYEKEHRAYAVRTDHLLNELEPLIADRRRNDPIATIVRMARARNTKRLYNHSLDKITSMEATLVGLRVSQQVIAKVLNRYDKGWKKRALEAAKKHKEKLAGKKK